MPELAEVEFYRRRWAAGHGGTVRRVHANERARVFRDADAGELARALTGARLLDSEAAAKQMLFRFDRQLCLGIHLGMSGELRVEPAVYTPAKHDHLVLFQPRRALVFSDPRMFGAVLFHHGTGLPPWWAGIAPAVLSRAFTRDAVQEFLRRRARAPIKAVLLMQERFPGVGNWMADEILWRTRVRPARLAGKLSEAEIGVLHRECRAVCRQALRTIAGVGSNLPPDLNVHIPDTWLFNHRWRSGGHCPRCGTALRYHEIGGRTSCWCPQCQRR